MGQIPRIPSRRRNGVLNYIIKKRNSAAVEAIRDLSTSLIISGREGQPKVIMSTSSAPGECKTTQTLALAHNLTGLGQRVLVIEGTFAGVYSDPILAQKRMQISCLSCPVL
ncbi:succinoglycan biosynthesis transport protein ExoP [Thalassobium sp. R2A62]|nr:succinoglycan biosynthesis transport protein ExoP [Thalassobium sp. R2A62]